MNAKGLIIFTVLFIMTLTSLLSMAKENQPLIPEIKYYEQLEQKNDQQTLVEELLGEAESGLEGARRVTRTSDKNYAVVLKSTNGRPRITYRLFETLEMSRACDRNGLGPCIVIEKNSAMRRKDDRVSVYYVAGNDSGNKRDESIYVGKYTIVRKDVKGESAQRAESLVSNQGDGIYVFSPAPDAEVAKLLADKAMDPKEACDRLSKQKAQEQKVRVIIEKMSSGLSVDQRMRFIESFNSTFLDVIPAAEASAERAQINEIIKNSSADRDNPVCGNPDLNFNCCYLKAKMRLVKRFVGIRVHTQCQTQEGTFDLPFRMSDQNEFGQEPVNQLFCVRPNGDIEKPKVFLNDNAVISVGWALSKKPQYLYASGVGYADNALDLVANPDFSSKKYSYLIQPQVPLFGTVVNPLIIGGREGYPVFAGNVSAMKISDESGSRFVRFFKALGRGLGSANVSLPGWYELGLDRGDF